MLDGWGAEGYESYDQSTAPSRSESNMYTYEADYIYKGEMEGQEIGCQDVCKMVERCRTDISTIV